MRNLILRGGLLLALLSACLWWEYHLLRAEEDSPPPPTAGGTRVLVLKTGQLVEGGISPTAGGYQVDLPKGNFLVPFERVRVVADDRHDAYEKLKAAEQNPSAEFRVALARWCIGWKLFEEARGELRDVLIADPDHAEARRMYAGLDRLMHPEEKPAAPPKPRSADGFQQRDPESLAGLSAESTRNFVLKVQPLLLNRCGNAGCHGPSSGQSFQIRNVGRGLNRQTLENLDAVLRLVNVSSPDTSPLLKTPAGAHGRNGRQVFAGSIGEQNLKTLKEWVAEVAQDLAGDLKEKSASGPFARREGRDQEPDETLIRGANEPPRPEKLSPQEQAAREKDELLESILRSEQKDAFDPEEFNRKYGR